MLQVLIVDDDPGMRTMLRAVMHYDGHMIQEASHGVEALAYLRASSVPLVVLLDWQMPQLDGFGVLRAVAADPQLAARHSFIVVTAADLQQDPEPLALLEYLRVPVVQKPFDIAEISEVVACAGTRQPATV